MGDQIEVVDTGKDPFEVEGTDPRGPYKKFENSFEELTEFGKLEEEIRKGGYNHSLPKIAEQEAQFILGKRKWVGDHVEAYGYDEQFTDYLKNSKPNDLPTLYPTIKTGLGRRKKEFEAASSQDLESIIKSTPDEKLGGLLNYLSPPPSGLSGEYKKLAELHGQVQGMGGLLGQYKEGKKGKPISDEDKKKLVKRMRGIVEDYYKTHPDYLESISEKDVEELDSKGNTITNKDRILKIKSDRVVALNLILETLKYSEGLVVSKFERIYEERREEFNKELEGKVPGYVKASLMQWKDVKKNDDNGLPDGKEYVLDKYLKLFNEKYKKQGQEE
jgi:hypothetical protein